MDYDEIPRNDDERTTLRAFLAWQRGTLERKCSGLSDDQMRQAAAPPSNLTLLGLLRHMADVERGWFRRTLAGEDIGERYSSDDDLDGDFDNVATADVQAAFASWREECALADEIMDRRALEATGKQRTGREVSMRWILNHMIEEYSRHNGHADLIRQAIDGATGYD
ncbi:MAG TPA: DinB family protein [Candidatus Saccharimonadales bacterium]|nr:DinB family protein [Candidatus Saccharimonadales bacterium]